MKIRSRHPLLILGAILLASFATACKRSSSSAPGSDPGETGNRSTGVSTTSEKPGDRESGTAKPPTDWVVARVKKAKERLQNTPAGEIVWESIEAHGGLDRWFGNGPIYFRFNYQPLGDGTTRDTYQTIDTWSARARHQAAEDPGIEFGWDGEKAWVKPATAKTGNNPRFWALTPYYFVAMPFVLADPGVNLELVGQKELVQEKESGAKSYTVVKATFDAKTGDAPDDYYVLYFEPETKRLRALRYVVSYPGFFPDGGHSPEKIMFYRGEQTTDDITLAARLPTHKWDEEAEEALEKVTDIDISDIEFRPATPSDYFEIPKGAKVLDGY